MIDVRINQFYHLMRVLWVLHIYGRIHCKISDFADYRILEFNDFN